MRQKYVIGNWKMNLEYAQAMALSDAIADGLQEDGECEVVLAAPFIYLTDVLRRVGHQERISVAAQNCSEHESGAFTGEVSAAMLASIGMEFVIIGHSERRSLYGEQDQALKGKVTQALKHGLTPVFCCGEHLEQRDSGKAAEVVTGQLKNGLFHLSENELAACIIAYEPVWAIGTGRTATPEQAQEMHAVIRRLLHGHAPNVADAIPLLYGGSVNASNAAELFSCQDVDGALVGGASLKSSDFISIINSCN